MNTSKTPVANVTTLVAFLTSGAALGALAYLGPVLAPSVLGAAFDVTVVATLAIFAISSLSLVKRLVNTPVHKKGDRV